MEEVIDELRGMLSPIFKTVGVTLGFILSLYIISSLFPQQTEVSPEEIKEVVIESVRSSVG
ncbi:MAG: hypothetical protein QXM12_00675 [Nitrososphaerota archaeon]